ncbi:MAG: hypothetical protein JXP34_08540 [Planctomycetes bacterium]|nr:hypothetical protein [Planctomycetota bacterium]
MTIDPTTMAKLDELAAAIRAHEDPRRAGAEWKQAYKLLQKTDLPAARVGHVVGMRDPVQLAELLEQLRAPEAEAEADSPDADVPDPETCKQAMRAFRKRLAITRLDHDSRLSGRDPLSKGGESKIAAIKPPMEWPASVWRELARQGKLRHVGQGCYELLEE